jgi:hypothetical protein
MTGMLESGLCVGNGQYRNCAHNCHSERKETVYSERNIQLPSAYNGEPLR